MTLRELHDQLEDENQHSLNAVLVAVAAEDEEAVIRLAQILAEHKRIGHIPYELSQERYAISQPLYKRLVEEGRL